MFCSKPEGFCGSVVECSKRGIHRIGEKISRLFRTDMGLSKPGKDAFLELLKAEKDIERIKRGDLNRIFKAISKRLENVPLPSVTAMELLISEGCNLRCDYCFEPYKRPAIMSVETGEKAIDFLIKESGDQRNLSVLFFGGEPLIGFDRIMEIVAYAEKEAEIYGKKIGFTMTTNGTLFTEESLSFCRNHDIKCMISLDGKEESHDRHRKTPDGRGSFGLISEKLSLIREYIPDFSVRMTPLPDTVGNLYENIMFLVLEVGTRSITLGGASGVGVEWTEEDYSIYEAEIEKVMRFWNESGRSFSISFLESVGTGEWGCQAGRFSVCITSEGNIIPCARVFGVKGLEDSYTFGNVHVGWTNPMARKELLALNSQRPRICYSCEYGGFCGGGCFVCNFRETGNLITPSPRECLEIKIQFHAREVAGVSTVARRYGRILPYHPDEEKRRPLLVATLDSVPTRCDDLIFGTDEDGLLSLYHVGRSNVYKAGKHVEDVLLRIDGMSSIRQIVGEISDKERYRAREEIEERTKSIISWLSHNHFIRIAKASSHPEEEGRPSSVSPPPILWESFFSTSSSMGIVSHENVLVIDGMGYPIYAHSWNDPSRDQFGKPAEPMDERVMDILRISKELPKGLEEEGIAISFGGTDFLRLDRWKKARIKTLYCFSDLTAIPKASVEILNLLDHIFVPSGFCRDNLIRSGVRTPITIWHHGVNPRYYRYMERGTRSPFTFLFVGVAQARKGIEELLTAFTDEFSRGEDVRLVVKSPDWGDLDMWKARFTDKRIIWHWTNVSREAMLDYYLGADCLVIPSRGDSFCLPVLEAMATGLPVIVHDWGGIKDYCDESNSYLVRNAGTTPGVDEALAEIYPYMPEWGIPDVDHLRYLLRYVYEHSEEAREKGRRAAKMVSEGWTWEHKAKEIVRLISEWGRQGP